MTTDATETLNLADARWGYRFGCDGVLQSSEAAERCGVTTKTLRRWAVDGLIRRGTLPTGSVIYCRRSIDDLLAESED